MGGYGALRIGMKHADVFGSLYVMSPCCLTPRAARPLTPAEEAALAAVKTPADVALLPSSLRSQLAGAAAWSPNPNSPPLNRLTDRSQEQTHREVGGERPAEFHRSVRQRAAALPRHRHGRRRPGQSARWREPAARRV